MESKKTIMVLSIASILVLAGFSINEKAYAGAIPNGNPIFPPFGDFTCWINIPGSALTTGIQIPPVPLTIVDQFGELTNDRWTQEEYCAATEKNGQLSPFSFTQPDELAQHYQGWTYPPGFDSEPSVLGTTVNLFVPQFNHDFQTTLLSYFSILVPADKILESNDLVTTEDKLQHWNCYEISGTAPDTSTVNLHTQHGDILNTIIEDPFLLCAPMIKTNQAQQTFQLLDIFDNENHMVCYDILADSDQSGNLPVSLIDQLAPGPLPFLIDFASQEHPLGLEKLCVPAIKSFPVIGGISIPIDQTALLLAGVQSISMWMIPVVIAGIGIGIFVIKRRK